MSKKHKRKKDKQVGKVAPPKSAQVLGIEKCWHDHPVLDLGGGKFHGASCVHPHDGYEIYVGLDWGMKRTVSYPWHAQPAASAVEIYFPIKDGSVPADPKEFAAMIDWLAQQLAEGKSMHAGCIGGHGRTGLLLAALVHRIHGDFDAGEWVRQHYCTQAIETQEQVEYLRKHFGKTKILPSRQYHQWSMQGEWSSKSGWQQGSGHKSSVYAPVKGRSMWSALAARLT